MNTTASFSSDHSWSRRCSTETVFSIQGQETDFVRDTSDTDACSDDRDLEYEPATDEEEQLGSEDSSESENEIITTKVIEVSVNDDGELQFADSEQTDSGGSDSEMDLHDYWKCAQCRATNNNPLYRYCEACFKVRKNFFPPRPKRKKRRDPRLSDIPRTLSQDSGVESQELSQGPNPDPMSITRISHQSSLETVISYSESVISNSEPVISNSGKLFSNLETVTLKSETVTSKSEAVISNSETVITKSETVSSLDLESCMNETATKSEDDVDKSDRLDSVQSVLPETSQNSVQVNKDNLSRFTTKRRAESADRNSKRSKIEYSESTSDSDTSRNEDISAIQPLVKTISDPSITVEDSINITKKVISTALKETVDKDLCIICCTEPKSGVFVHGRVAHICCCYKCAVKVWQKAKRCPVCNSKVSNVLKAVVM